MFSRKTGAMNLPSNSPAASKAKASRNFMVKLKKAPMRDIAAFVSSRLSVIEEVQSTTTHVVLKQYKDHGTMFVGKSGDKRMVVTP